MATTSTVPAALQPLEIEALTDSAQNDGSFDVLMASIKGHLKQEYDQGRIRAGEYSTVYLGSLQSVLATSLQFLMQKTAANQDSLVKAKQLSLMDLQAEAAQLQNSIAQQQLSNLAKEGENLVVQKALLQAQVDIAAQQKLNLQDELLTAAAQRSKLAQEAVNLGVTEVLLGKQADQVTQQNLNLAAQKLQVEAETALTAAKTANSALEGEVLTAQKCKLQAEFDVLILTKSKTTSETELLEQKIVTEKAQVTALGVDEDSVVGRQKQLYVAQATGFGRDAEQKAAKMMIDSWNVRRTTDEGTSANSTNKLDDAAVGRAVTKMLEGIGA